jgi:malonate decarboxylase alpha subunit
MKNWSAQRTSLTERLSDGGQYASGKTVEAADLSNFLQAVIRPGDRICLEGDNQKQADVLAAALANIDPAKIHDLHMVQSGVVLPEHLDVFEKGIARRLDYFYSGPQASRIARMLFGGKIELGAIHTYLELFARYFIDLTPQVALIAAVSADRDGNLYTGPNTEDSPTVVEATSFKSGLVVAQVTEIVDRLPRVDIPGDQAHFVVEAKKPFYVEPLFTRDPAAIPAREAPAEMLPSSTTAANRCKSVRSKCTAQVLDKFAFCPWCRQRQGYENPSLRLFGPTDNSVRMSNPLSEPTQVRNNHSVLGQIKQKNDK